MKKGLNKIILFGILFVFLISANVKAAENAYANTDVAQQMEYMSNYLGYVAGDEDGWNQTISYGEVDKSTGTPSGQEVASLIADGGMIFETTGAWNYTTIESMNTTSVNDVVTAKVSPEIVSQIQDGNLSLQLNYYERNDKSLSEWVNSTGGVDEGLYAFYYGDGWESLSASEKNEFAAFASTQHSSLEANMYWDKIPAKNNVIFTSENFSISEEGIVSFKLTDGMKNGVFAGLSVNVVDVNGNIIGTVSFDELGQPTFNKGDAEEEAKKEEKPPIPEDTNNHVWHSISSSITPYVDKTPNVTSRIFNDNPYTVQQSIPTSERLIYELSAKKAFHDIEVRRRVLSAGAKEITIRVVASYSYEKWEPIKYKRIRGKWVASQ